MRRFSLISMVAAAVLIPAAASAEAATYYVSQSSGNDNWTGQAADPNGTTGPWKTLAKVSTIEYAPGDRILLKCGDTWNDKFKWKNCRFYLSPGEKLLVIRTTSGNPGIAEFAAYNDTSGEVFNVPRGSVPPGRVGK